VSQETREAASLHQILPGGLFHLLNQADGVKGFLLTMATTISIRCQVAQSFTPVMFR